MTMVKHGFSWFHILLPNLAYSSAKILTNCYQETKLNMRVCPLTCYNLYDEIALVKVLTMVNPVPWSALKI